MKYKTQRIILIIAFLFVPLVLLIAFTFLPTVSVFWYSLHKWNGLSPKEFIGLDNYVQIFSDPKYFLPLVNSLYYLVGAILQMVLGLFFATLLTYNLRFKNGFKGILFFPYLINGVAVGLMFTFFFRGDGLLNTITGLLGYTNDGYLMTPFWNNVLLSLVSVWRYMGFNLVMFLGAIQSVSSDVLEAAEIDGANKFTIFLRIIFPMIKNIILLNLILAVKGAVSVFEVPYIMTGGSFDTSTFVIETINMGMKNTRRQVGLASALSTVLFFIILIVTVVQKLIFREKENNY